MSAFKSQLADPYDVPYGPVGYAVPFPTNSPPFQRHSETSRDAAQSIAKHIGALHHRVLAYLKNHPQGATDEQISDGTVLRESTALARRVELTQANLVKDSGRYALTRSWRKATVWVTT